MHGLLLLANSMENVYHLIVCNCNSISFMYLSANKCLDIVYWVVHNLIRNPYLWLLKLLFQIANSNGIIHRAFILEQYNTILPGFHVACTKSNATPMQLM